MIHLGLCSHFVLLASSFSVRVQLIHGGVIKNPWLQGSIDTMVNQLFCGSASALTADVRKDNADHYAAVTNRSGT